ncbi:MAG: hypothetical protein R3Y24_08585 [Eubacteriales bacterium]
MRLKNLLIWDFKLQLRYHILLAAIVITSVWFFVLYLLPNFTMSIALPIVFITDFTVTGFLLTAAMIFFEKSQDTISALVITPVKIKEYILSKTISIAITLTCISFLLGVFIVFVKDVTVNLLLVALAAFLSCTTFILMGICISTFYDSFTKLILPMGVLFSILFIPFLSYVNNPSLDFLDYVIGIFPTYSMIILVNGAMGELSIWSMILSIAYLLLINFLLFKLSLQLFSVKIIGREHTINE